MGGKIADRKVVIVSTSLIGYKIYADNYRDS